MSADILDPPDGNVYVLQFRICRKGRRTTRERWMLEAVFRTRAEAEVFARAKERRHYRHGWTVYGVPAAGELASRLMGD